MEGNTAASDLEAWLTRVEKPGVRGTDGGELHEHRELGRVDGGADSMTDVTFSVPEIHCEGCASNIRKGLDGLPGLAGVLVDVGHRRVTVSVTPEAQDDWVSAARKRIEDCGFDVN